MAGAISLGGAISRGGAKRLSVDLFGLGRLGLDAAKGAGALALVFAFAAALVLMAPTARAQMAPGAGVPIYEDISGPEIKRLLAAAGIESTLSSDRYGQPLITARAGDTAFVVRTFECGVRNGETRCNRMQYRASFDLQSPPSRASMNAFNRTWVFGKAYVSEDGLAAIEYPLNLTLGVTEDNLVHNFALWVVILEEFIAHISTHMTS